MIPLSSVAIGAAVWAAIVVVLSLTSFRPTVYPVRPTLRAQLRRLDRVSR